MGAFVKKNIQSLIMKLFILVVLFTLLSAAVSAEDADQDLGDSSGSPKFSGGSHHVLGDEYGADGESDEDADQDLGASSGSPKFSGGSHHVLGDEYGADGESDEGKYVVDEYDP